MARAILFFVSGYFHSLIALILADISESRCVAGERNGLTTVKE